MSEVIRVVIADDHQVVLDGFMARLELEPDISVIGTASNGLEAALSSLLLDFQAHSGIEVETLFSTQPGQLKSEAATTLYRVVQESLNNIEKHAQATKVTVIAQQIGLSLIHI